MTTKIRLEGFPPHRIPKHANRRQRLFSAGVALISAALLLAGAALAQAEDDLFSSEIPESPVQYSCQKNFIIVITDGEPTGDDFKVKDPTNTARGFGEFSNLIGDYNPDGENEEPGSCFGCSFYLDDIAKFMHENDFRPDMEGDQTLDIYTIGFTTNATANALLQKTATQGNGLFFTSNSAEELRAVLVSSISDILEKAEWGCGVAGTVAAPAVAPNVLIQLDNSGSMNHIVWHPAFDPDGTYDCSYYSSNYTYYLSSTISRTRCGRTLTLYHDPQSNSYTWYSGKYLNWLFSSQNTVQSEIDDTDNGVRICQGPGSPTYAKYQINRLSSANRVVLDTMCEVLATKNIRFGLSVFRDTYVGDPNGGYIEVGIDDNSQSHQDDLEASILATKAETWTPLAETLFQSYTYFMSRNTSQMPPGATSGTFPVYKYKTTPNGVGGEYTNTLFTSSVAPNVLIQLDNSGSMNHIVWHPAFDPDGAYDCSYYSSNYTYYLNSTITRTRCGRTRTLYHDPQSNSYTWYSGKYLNWLFSSQNTVQSEIDDTDNGTKHCPGASPATYAKYQINRLSSAKRVVLDTMCEVLATKNIRFGLSVFRDTYVGDPNGGYIEVGIDDNSESHQDDLEDSVVATKAETWTPLAETLFQSYTYFMSRDSSELPPGNTSGTFPLYSYVTSPSNVGGLYTSTLSLIPPSPIEFTCQKNFVIIITDGEPTRDNFDTESPTNTAAGFSNFSSLIGDYNPDGEIEEPAGTSSWLYLDDVAKFMHENDCRPDMEGDQTLDIYTIGFTTGTEANALLQKTADVGNGLFFTSNNPDELRTVLVSSISDILEKAESGCEVAGPVAVPALGGAATLLLAGGLALMGSRKALGC